MAQIPLSLNENSADSNGIGPGGTGSGDPGPHEAGPQAPQKKPGHGVVCRRVWVFGHIHHRLCVCAAWIDMFVDSLVNGPSDLGVHRVNVGRGRFPDVAETLVDRRDERLLCDV